MRILLFLTIFLNICDCRHQQTHRNLRRYSIDLDSPPSQRWNHVIRDHLDQLSGVVDEAKKYVPQLLQPLVWRLAATISRFFPNEIREELKGIALESGLEFGEIVGLNILYDVAAFDRKHIFGLGCTSIVAQNSRRQIFHGRNLDYDMTELLKNITIFVDFKKSGKTVYSGITFALYNGLLTGQRAGAYSVSLNARYSGAYIDTLLMEIYTKFRRPVSFFIRQVLETESTYYEAVEALKTTHLVSPSYIIVAGVGDNQGCIISRNRWRAVDVFELSPSQWFLVETNFDHWKGDSDPRRLRAIAMLKSIGPKRLDRLSMDRILSTHPIHNNLTVFSTIMSAANPQLFFNSTKIID